jgi:hypothetical protein
MDQAYNSTEYLTANALLLYGEKDQVIPKQATFQFLHNLTKATPGLYTMSPRAEYVTWLPEPGFDTRAWSVLPISQGLLI